MATLLLQAAVGVAVSYGLSVVGAMLTPDQKTTQEGARLKKSQVTFATEGDAISRHWGRNRLGGNIIWATRFKETKNTETVDNGGKGVQNKSTVETVTYTYSVSFAVAFCEGNNRTQLGRVWADGKLMDLSGVTYRFYAGTETQSPDTFIETIEGAGNVPAYRGLCYLVFEGLQLEAYGNRIPQVTAEIIKGPATIDGEELESVVTGIQLIPGAGEFVYGTRRYVATDGQGNSTPQNVHNVRGVANLVASLDVMDASAPEIDTVSLVVAWFGDDLRAGNCTIRPKVEVTTAKNVTPQDWAAGGIASRASAVAISTDPQGRPYYGGTPSDVTVREAIAELKSRGKRVMFYPFILMDVPPSNTLTDPYTGGTGQPAFPWRGRITCNPAPGEAGTPDKTGAAATQIAAFTGTAAPGNFGSWNGATIPYSGPNEWSYRRMILHYAKLLGDLMGSGDAFIIGSEMVGLTTVRESATAYPFVDDLVTLAGDVSGMLGSGVLVSYAADWSEYHSHRPGDGSGDVLFNLDPLWSSANIDFIGIDNYLPMSDWRDGMDHLDFQAGFKSIYQKEYLRANVEGGEYFDWYYADSSARDSQTRTPITDGTYGEPWVFGNKNLRGWWESAHHNRPGGVRSGSATAWTPESKPIWFTEYGCPAVDKGTNQPNVFFDPKSSESFLPYYSSGTADDLIQRRYIEETVGYWADNAPTSGVYAGPMISPANMLAWCWDARPYPEFPLRTDVWSDGPNYNFGHWLNGRLPLIPVPTLAEELSGLVEIAGVEIDVDNLFDALAVARGFTITAVASPREILETLGEAFFFDAFSSEGVIRFSLRQYAPMIDLSIDDLVVTDDMPGGYELTRGQETELPAIAKVTFWDETNDYQLATVDALRQTGQSKATITADLPLVIPESYARSIPQMKIMEAWTARETGRLALPPSKLAIDPGDVLAINIKGRAMTLRIDGFDEGEFRNASVKGFDIANYGRLEFASRQASIPIVPFYGPPVFAFLNLPLFSGQESRPWAPRVVAYQDPWPGSVIVYRDDNAGGWLTDTVVQARSPIGELTFDLYSGPTDYWDDVNDCYVTMYSADQLLGTTDLAVLNGANLLAVQNADGEWEVLQFVNAELQSAKKYKLTRLLRGRGGTEHAMRSPVAAGARVVFLSTASLYPLNVPQSMLFQDVDFRVGPGTVDVSDFRFTTQTVNIAGVGLRPFSPVHLEGDRDGSGDWSLTWIRRTRFGGGGWDAPDAPLNEESEKYDLEIMDGGTVVREVLGLTSPAYAYTAAMQAADFGSTQATLTFRVYQISATYGRGTPGTGTVYA